MACQDIQIVQVVQISFQVYKTRIFLPNKVCIRSRMGKGWVIFVNNHLHNLHLNSNQHPIWTQRFFSTWLPMVERIRLLYLSCEKLILLKGTIVSNVLNHYDALFTKVGHTQP